MNETYEEYLKNKARHIVTVLMADVPEIKEFKSEFEYCIFVHLEDVVSFTMRKIEKSFIEQLKER
jgi:hypothetical protein